MPLYPLGITRRRDLPAVAEQAMLGQAGVRWVLADGLACAVINSPEVPPRPLEHVVALDAIHRRISVLPIRFGTQMSNEEKIHNLLFQQRQELLQCLDHVEGTSEIDLRISSLSCQPTEAAFPAEASLPATYLTRRRVLYQREERLNNGQARLTIDRYVRKLDGLYRQWRNFASSPPGLVRLAFLVERDRVGLFRQRLEAIRDVKQGEQCDFLGPWPPYSFV